MKDASYSNVQRALVALFGALLVFPLAGHLFTLSPDRPTEKRPLAPWPQPPTTLAELRDFPPQLNHYLNDHFGFRNQLIGWSSQLSYALGVASTPDVLIGKNGWLFYASKTDGDPLQSFRGLDLYTAEQLDQWSAFVEAQRRWLEQRNIPFIFVAVPNKHSVYAEFMPDWLKPASGPTRFDQLSQKAATLPQLDFLDLRPVLAAAKSEVQVYRKTDSHWNHRGALYAYLATMGRAQAYFPELAVYPSEEIRFEAKPAPGDLAQMLHLATQLPDETLEVSFTAPAGHSRARHLLIVGDSYSQYWTSFFARSFDKVDHALRGGYGELPKAWIETHQPDLVILQMVERYL